MAGIQGMLANAAVTTTVSTTEPDRMARTNSHLDSKAYDVNADAVDKSSAESTSRTVAIYSNIPVPKQNAGCDTYGTTENAACNPCCTMPGLEWKHEGAALEDQYVTSIAFLKSPAIPREIRPPKI